MEDEASMSGQHERLEIIRRGRTIEVQYHTEWHSYVGRGLHIMDALDALSTAIHNGDCEWTAVGDMTKWQDEREW